MSTSTPSRQHEPVQAPRRRSGAHRSGGGVVGALLPSALAVAAVASLITALAVWQGEPAEPPGAAASTTRAQATSAAATPTPTPSPTPTADATSEAASPTSSPPTSEAPVPDMEVVVLNQTARGGLAGTVADRLRGQGWDVYGVGNFRGVVPDTTVYYPDGARAEALAVAGDLPTEPRVRPRFGNLSTTRLTVVVTDSYPAG